MTLIKDIYYVIFQYLPLRDLFNYGKTSSKMHELTKNFEYPNTICLSPVPINPRFNITHINGKKTCYYSIDTIIQVLNDHKNIKFCVGLSKYPIDIINRIFKECPHLKTPKCNIKNLYVNETTITSLDNFIYINCLSINNCAGINNISKLVNAETLFLSGINIDHIPVLPNLKHITLRNINDIPVLPNLESITVIDSNITDLSHLRALKYIHLRNCNQIKSIVLNNIDGFIVNKCDNLTNIRIKSARRISIWNSAIKDISSFINVKHLNLTNCKDIKNYEILDYFMGNILNLSNCNISKIPKIKYLKNLYLSRCPINNFDQLRKMHIDELVLIGMKINNLLVLNQESYNKIRFVSCQSLESLEPLKDTQIGELQLVNCRSLTDIPVFTNVHTLIIDRCTHAFQMNKFKYINKLIIDKKYIKKKMIINLSIYHFIKYYKNTLTKCHSPKPKSAKSVKSDANISRSR